MPLTDQELERYARHVIIPEVGASGQELLLESSVAIVGSRAGSEVADRYLQASGVATRVGSNRREADCILIAGLSTLTAQQLDRLSNSGKPLVWYELGKRGFSCGIRRDSDDPPLANSDGGAQQDAGAVDAALHAIAASEAAGVALALLLGWDLPTDTREVTLA